MSSSNSESYNSHLIDAIQTPSHLCVGIYTMLNILYPELYTCHTSVYSFSSPTENGELHPAQGHTKQPMKTSVISKTKLAEKSGKTEAFYFVLML